MKVIFRHESRIWIIQSWNFFCCRSNEIFKDDCQKKNDSGYGVVFLLKYQAAITLTNIAMAYRVTREKFFRFIDRKWSIGIFFVKGK